MELHPSSSIGNARISSPSAVVVIEADGTVGRLSAQSRRDGALCPVDYLLGSLGVSLA
jgi:hypothetical protein